jgi:hypothetical protein
VPPRSDVPLLSPDYAARLFLDALPMSRDEARARTAIRGKINNMLTPLTTFRHLISDPDLSRRVAEWAELREGLP